MLGHRRFGHGGLVRGGLAGHREQVSRELQPVWKTPARPVRAPADRPHAFARERIGSGRPKLFHIYPKNP